jgi:hypothetical protein
VTDFAYEYDPKFTRYVADPEAERQREIEERHRIIRECDTRRVKIIPRNRSRDDI